MRAVDGSLIRSVAAYGIPSACMFPDRPLPEAPWRSLLAQISRLRLSGFLQQAISDGVFPVAREQAAEAHDVHLQAMGWCTFLERAAVRTVRALNENDIDCRVLKGPAMAHLVYPSPSWRAFVDIDLLVPAARFSGAISVLGSIGYRREAAQLRDGYDERFSKAVTLRHGDGNQLDLHRSFAVGRFGLDIRAADLFDTASPFQLAGVTVLALAPSERFLNACYHASLGARHRRMLALRDVAQMVVSTDFDHGRVHDLASEWRGLAVLSDAVTMALDTLAVPSSSDIVRWARGHRPTRKEQRALNARTTAQESRSALTAIRGPSAKAAFLRALAFPSRTSLAESGHRGYWSWWMHGVRGRGSDAGEPEEHRLDAPLAARNDR